MTVRADLIKATALLVDGVGLSADAARLAYDRQSHIAAGLADRKDDRMQVFDVSVELSVGPRDFADALSEVG